MDLPNNTKVHAVGLRLWYNCPHAGKATFAKVLPIDEDLSSNSVYDRSKTINKPMTKTSE